SWKLWVKGKNATFLSGNEAGKISREGCKSGEKRIVKSTNCNERSSELAWLIILDVPTVGGRLMLVDMAGSEIFEQAAKLDSRQKMQVIYFPESIFYYITFSYVNHGAEYYSLSLHAKWCIFCDYSIRYYRFSRSQFIKYGLYLVDGNLCKWGLWDGEINGLDMGDPQPVIVHEVKEILPGDVLQTENFSSHTLLNPSSWKSPEEEQEYDAYLPRLPDKVYLSTVFEEEENEGEERDNTEDVEVEKEIVEEHSTYSRSHLDQLEKGESWGAIGELENSKEAISARLNRYTTISCFAKPERALSEHQDPNTEEAYSSC
ncbi:hypothetical protein GIB67_025684, partial [Kingdonia uniflora]